MAAQGLAEMPSSRRRPHSVFTLRNQSWCLGLLCDSVSVSVSVSNPGELMGEMEGIAEWEVSCWWATDGFSGAALWFQSFPQCFETGFCLTCLTECFRVCVWRTERRASCRHALLHQTYRHHSINGSFESKTTKTSSLSLIEVVTWRADTFHGTP